MLEHDQPDPLGEAPKVRPAGSVPDRVTGVISLPPPAPTVTTAVRTPAPPEPRTPEEPSVSPMVSTGAGPTLMVTVAAADDSDEPSVVL